MTLDAGLNRAVVELMDLSPNSRPASSIGAALLAVD